ncbi:DNA helicase [Tanacetum coccineum]
MQQKAIVCPRNNTANIINSMILSTVEGESTIYRSSDEAIQIGNDGGEIDLLYPSEYLNTLQVSGFSPHELELKVGIPIMLLRNVNLCGGLYAMTQKCISDLKPGARNKVLEAKVYRKWISRRSSDPAPKDYSCILLDREGNAVQANMGNKDIPYFSSILQDGAAISPDEFPNHFFNFVSYNQLHYKIPKPDAKAYEKQPTLTVELALWDDMARNFKKGEYDLMEKPVIIAVSSCKVSLYGGTLQLSGTNATHYYLNPDNTDPNIKL